MVSFFTGKWYQFTPALKESALKMFLRAIAQGFKVDYLLMDSWFTCEAFIDAVLNVKHQVTHLIGMYKTPRPNLNTWEAPSLIARSETCLVSQRDAGNWDFITIRLLLGSGVSK